MNLRLKLITQTAIFALFNNTRPLKLKTQPTVSFSTAANIITDVLGNNDAKWSKGHV